MPPLAELQELTRGEQERRGSGTPPVPAPLPPPPVPKSPQAGGPAPAADSDDDDGGDDGVLYHPDIHSPLDTDNNQTVQFKRARRDRAIAQMQRTIENLQAEGSEPSLRKANQIAETMAKYKTNQQVEGTAGESIRFRHRLSDPYTGNPWHPYEPRRIVEGYDASDPKWKGMIPYLPADGQRRDIPVAKNPADIPTIQPTRRSSTGSPQPPASQTSAPSASCG
jgi:hypothetical protein